MRRAFAIGIIMFVSSLGLASSGEAQSGSSDSIVQTQTTVQAVDCDSQQVTLAGVGTSSVVQSTLGSIVQVNGAATPFCSLSSYIGSPATAWVMARGGQFVLVRLDVTSTGAPGYPATPQPPLAPASVPADSSPTAASPSYTQIPYTPIPSTPGYTPPSYSPGPSVPSYSPGPSVAAAVLGTVLVGGIVYLLVRAANGSLYRYPYNGGYGYQPYRPYVGPYVNVPAYSYGPYRRCRDGAWGQWCR